MHSCSIFPHGEQKVELAANPDHSSYPLVATLGSLDSYVNVFMTYAEGIELSRLLRVACGVEEPKAEEAA